MKRLSIENVRAAANMYGVHHADVANIEDLGGGRYFVVSRGEVWTFFEGVGSLELESRVPAGAAAMSGAEKIAAPTDPGTAEEDKLRALEERLGGGSRASGRRVALAWMADLIERGVVVLPDED